MLHIHEDGAHIIWQCFAQQQADVRVQLVHITHGVGTGAVLGNAGVVTQAGGAVITGAGGDLCQTVAHRNSLWSAATKPCKTGILRYIAQADVVQGNNWQKAWTGRRAAGAMQACFTHLKESHHGTSTPHITRL